MTKMGDSKKAKKGISVHQGVLLDMSTDGELIDIENMKETWSEYTLKDGTLLKVKPIIMEIRRLKSHHATNGDPVYFVKSTVITDTVVSANLKKK